MKTLWHCVVTATLLSMPSCYVSEHAATTGPFVSAPVVIDIPWPDLAVVDAEVVREWTLSSSAGVARRRTELSCALTPGSTATTETTFSIARYAVCGVDGGLAGRMLNVADSGVETPTDWPPELGALFDEIVLRATRRWSEGPLRPPEPVRSADSWSTDPAGLLDDPISGPLRGVVFEADRSSAFAQVTTLLPLTIPVAWSVELHGRVQPIVLPQAIIDRVAELAAQLGEAELKLVRETEPASITASIRARQRGLYPARPAAADRFETVRVVAQWRTDRVTLELEFVEQRHRRFRDA